MGSYGHFAVKGTYIIGSWKGPQVDILDFFGHSDLMCLESRPGVGYLWRRLTLAQRQRIKMDQEKNKIALVRKDVSKNDPSKKSVNLVLH